MTKHLGSLESPLVFASPWYDGVLLDYVPSSLVSDTLTRDQPSKEVRDTSLTGPYVSLPKGTLGHSEGDSRKNKKEKRDESRSRTETKKKERKREGKVD